MNAKEENLQGGDADFDTFWKNFQISPWKWADKLASRSRYLISSALFIYALTAIVTFFPDNPWMAPLKDEFWNWYLGEDQILLLIHYKSFNFIFIAAIIAIALIIRWRHQIPGLFQWLWDNQRLGIPTNVLKNNYMQYLQDYQKALGSKLGSTSISVALMVIFTLLVLYAGVIEFFTDFYTPLAAYASYFGLLTAVLWFFMIGQFSWAMFVTGVYIGKLHKRFAITVQPSHPDKCGGLKPLGDFAIDGALPWIVLGILFAVLSIFELDIDDVTSIISTVFLFVLVAPVTALSIFLPLWNIHNEMAHQKREYEDEFAAKMSYLEQTINSQTKENGDLGKAKEAKEKLEILQLTHPEKISYPVWPLLINGTVLAVFSPQIITTAIDIGTYIIDLIP